MLRIFALLTVALMLASPVIANAADVGGGGLRKTPAHTTTHKPAKKPMHGVLPGSGDSRIPTGALASKKTGGSGTATPPH
jgi:hypothetical protein